MSSSGAILVRAPTTPRRPRSADSAATDPPHAIAPAREVSAAPSDAGRLGLRIGAALGEAAGTTVVVHPARPRFGMWLNRSRRILLLLAAVWVINIFDLGYTLAERGTIEFVELNPIAAVLLNGPTHVVTAFKFSMLGLGTLILLSLRRYTVAELACWFLLAAKLYVAIRWLLYFDCLVHGQSNPLLESPLPS